MFKVPKSLIFGVLFSLVLMVPSLVLLPVFANSGNPHSIVNPPVVTKSPSWAGYGIVAPNAGVTAIRSSFIQPAVRCNPAIAGRQITWFLGGLDGVISTDFEVVGTAAVCVPGNNSPTYSEIASVAMVPILPIVAGHVYVAAIITSGGVFHYLLKDVNTGKISKGTGSGPNIVTAAECIVARAAPGGSPAPLANFGVASFGQDYTAAKNSCFATAQGSTKPIGAFSVTIQVHRYVMYNTALTAVDAATSAVTPTLSSFKVTFVNAGP